MLTFLFLKTILENEDTLIGDVLITSKLINEKIDIIRIHEYKRMSEVKKFMNYFDYKFY